MSLKTMLSEINYGEPKYNVRFVGIKCLKSDFSDYDSGGCDIGKIEKYGLAIYTAKAFKEEEWFLTKSNILVCGKVPQLPTLKVIISVDKNLLFLVSQNKERIKEGYAVEVFIEGPDITKVETVASSDASWGIIFGPLK